MYNYVFNHTTVFDMPQCKALLFHKMIIKNLLQDAEGFPTIIL